MKSEGRFEEAKEVVYDLFQKRCGQLLQDFLSEKEKAVCPLCSDSCTEIEKTHKGLLLENAYCSCSVICALH